METLIISLGSSVTTIFREGEGVVLKEASMVAVAGSGKEQIVKAVGDKAKFMLGRTSSDTRIINPIYEGVVADNELASVMLKYFIDKIYGKKLFRPKICAIICVPVGISIAEKKAFEKVCYGAKILDVALVPNVVCGALGLNLEVHTPRAVMVVNIGATTTNIAILSLNSVVSGACLCVGGKNIDVAIENELQSKFGIDVGPGVTEKIKVDIGSLYPNDSLTFAVQGIDVETKGSRTENIESKDIYGILDYFYDKIVKGIESVLAGCLPDIINDIKHDFIYVYGGASRITGLERYIKNKLQMKVDVVDEINNIDILGCEKLLNNPKQLETIIKNL